MAREMKMNAFLFSFLLVPLANGCNSVQPTKKERKKEGKQEAVCRLNRKLGRITKGKDCFKTDAVSAFLYRYSHLDSFLRPRDDGDPGERAKNNGEIKTKKYILYAGHFSYRLHRGWTKY